MTETDVPMLTPGPDLSRTALQALTVIGGALRERRLAVGRAAWTESQNSAHTAERHLRAADPPVREMSDSESEIFGRQTAAGAAGFETHEFQDGNWKARATVGPLSEGRGWGVAAETVELDSDGVEHTNSAWVVVKVEAEARELAEDVLTGGPPKVERLGRFSQFATERAEHARTEVRESRNQLMARTADAVRRKWPGELAERMVQPGPDDVGRGNRWNDTLGALAWHLQRLEDRGYAMDDVLDRIGRTEALRNADEPAAMAASFVKKMAPDLQVVNLDGDGKFADESRDQGADQVARRRTDGHGGPAASPAELRAAQAAIREALRDTEAVERVESSRGYERLQNQLGEVYGRGRALDDLLADLPTKNICDARDPAEYLAAVVMRKVENRPLQKTRPDHHSAAETVRGSLPPETAAAVTDCHAWPGLAKRITGWEAEGLPVSEMLASLPADRIRTADHPASYATVIMNSKAQSRRAAGAEGTSAAGRRERDRRDRDAANPVVVVDGAGAASLDVSAPAFSESELDPTSAVDRVGLEASHGVGTPADDARIERLIDRTESDGSRAQSATAELLRADAADRDAAHAAATPDDPGTQDLREDMAGQDEARGDHRFADAARASAAADEHGAQAAAAVQADRSYRIPDQPSAAQTSSPRAQPAPPATVVRSPSIRPNPASQVPRAGR